MSEFSVTVRDWLDCACGTEEERATTGALRITAGEGLRFSLTEVEDDAAKSVRTHIYVPTVAVAEWFLMNWWRLRWEGKPKVIPVDWFYAHRLSAVGGDHVWPSLEFSSDGDFILLKMSAEDSRDVSSIRYLRTIELEVAAVDFEAAIDDFSVVVESRLAARAPAYRSICELREELSKERKSVLLSKQCRWQARAGLTPGSVDERWLREAQALIDETGEVSGEEIMSALPDLESGLHSAKSDVESLRRSPLAIDLTWARQLGPKATREHPWQTGVRLAQQVRKDHNLGTGRISDKALSELISTHFPMNEPPRNKGGIGGGFRGDVVGGRTKIACNSRRPESQRFYLARVIGAAHVLAPDQRLIPVTEQSTALQKTERAFAQEFLCPLKALDAFTRERGMDEDALLDAAEHFGVSDYVVRSTLVNRGRMSRDRLPPI